MTRKRVLQVTHPSVPEESALDVIPIDELVNALRRRAGVASVVAYIDLTEPDREHPWRVMFSRTSLPLAKGLASMIDEEVKALTEEVFYPEDDD